MAMDCTIFILLYVFSKINRQNYGMDGLAVPEFDGRPYEETMAQGIQVPAMYN